MSWEHKNSMTKVFNAFKRNKERVYESDIDALKILNDLVESGHEKIALDNKLFAKMLCYYLNRMALHYGDIKLAISDANNELSKDLNVHVTELTYTLNKLEEFKKAQEIKNASYILNINKPKWRFERVYSSFIATCNDFIKDIKNYG